MTADQAVNVTIRGTVIDASNSDPLINAIVKQKGTSNGVNTNIDGKFSISLPVGSTLEISYLGYVTQEIKVTNNTTLEVQLKPDDQLLDEVVVVGYAAQKKVNLTGAVASVDFTEATNSRPMTTMGAALSGMSAGLNVMQTGGKPNSEGLNVSIRGLWHTQFSRPAHSCRRHGGKP